MSVTKAVLFDLDGTLLDTAPDFCLALNILRAELNLPTLSLEDLRPVINFGTKHIIKRAFNIDETASEYQTIKTRFLEIYTEHLSDTTDFFPNMEQVLTFLEKKGIPWGIVTNRLTQFTMQLMDALGQTNRPGCIVCGDTLPQSKPDPKPILHACGILQQDPKNSIFIGDAATDILAGKAAGTTSLLALYGYLDPNLSLHDLQAEGHINTPLEILDWLQFEK